MMYKCLTIVLLFIVLVSFFNKPYKSNEELEREEKVRTTLLSHCDAKFQHYDNYYAICSYDKTIKLTYIEYVELNNVPVQTVPDSFLQAELKSKNEMYKIALASLSFFLFLGGIIFLVKRAFFDGY